MDRQEQSDSAWARIEPHLPGKVSDPGRTSRDNRLFVEAMALAASIDVSTLRCCLVATHHWDLVGWAIAEYAWRFEPLIDEVK